MSVPEKDTADLTAPGVDPQRPTAPNLPLTRGVDWQSRAGSNRRFRLERPAS